MIEGSPAVKIRLKFSKWDFSETRQLGRSGGFGAVYRCAAPDGDVAIKRLHISANDAAHREMKLAASLISRDLKHVVPVLDYGLNEAGGGYFLVMPLCAGTLQDELDEKGPLSSEDAKTVALDILHGLNEVGDIVHRDLKPANVLRMDDRWCVSDFGIAKFVEDSTSLETLRDCLTPSYGAPEQWRSEAPTRATDIYALGCVMHTMLTGRPPFQDAVSLKAAHLNERPPSISGIDDVLASLIAGMLRKDPLARPSVDRCIQALQRRGAGDALVFRPPLARADRAIVDGRVGWEVDRSQLADAGSRRHALAQDGVGEMREICTRLRAQIELHTELSERTTGNRFSVGNGVLEVGTPEILDIYTPPVMFTHEQGVRGPYPYSAWDVLAHASLRIEQRNYDRRGPRGLQFCWESLLFFGRHPEQQEYRWWEAAFRNLSDVPNGRRTHPVKPDDPGFDLALAGELYVVQLAFGPVAIDAENELSARMRWLDMLAKAATSELNRRQPPIPMTDEYLESIRS